MTTPILGGVDPNAPATVANAWAAGMSHVDVYLFPCYKCGDAAGQVKETGKYDNRLSQGAPPSEEIEGIAVG